MPMPDWIALDPRITDVWLYPLASMLNTDNPKSAQEQLDDGYKQFGGYKPFPGFTLNPNLTMNYPGDPVMIPMAMCELRDELIILYPGDWVAVVQKNGIDFVCARMS